MRIRTGEDSRNQQPHDAQVPQHNRESPVVSWRVTIAICPFDGRRGYRRINGADINARRALLTRSGHRAATHLAGVKTALRPFQTANLNGYHDLS
jgi:hypothetical protein